MIRSLYRTQDGQIRTDLTVDEFAAALQDADGLLWVDLSCESAETCEPILRQTFGFHPLAVDDALEEAHVPKVDNWEEYLYVALHAVAFSGQDDEPVGTQELDIFLGAQLPGHVSGAAYRHRRSCMDGLSTGQAPTAEGSGSLAVQVSR